MSRAREASWFAALIIVVAAIVVGGDALAEPPLPKTIGERSADVASALGDAHLQAPRSRDQAVALGIALAARFAAPSPSSANSTIQRRITKRCSLRHSEAQYYPRACFPGGTLAAAAVLS